MNENALKAIAIVLFGIFAMACVLTNNLAFLGPAAVGFFFFWMFFL